MQRNFILTDVMKTGDHQMIERFLDQHSMSDQSFDYTGEYYTLHNYDVDSYDRRLAMIDMRFHNDRLGGNSNYHKDLQSRMALLHQQGFKFILAYPWESQENIRTETFIEGRKIPKVQVPYPHFTWTGGVSWFWFYMLNKHNDRNFKATHDHNGSYWYKKHDFLYLNKGARDHRVKLYERLMGRGVLDNSIHTFIERKPPKRLNSKYELPGIDPERYPRWGKDQDLYELPYEDTVFSLVSETNDVGNEIFMTEKIWKPIMAQQPFVVHGNYLYLQKLREMGFHTFNNYFDESYDLERDRDKRIDKIVSLCENLKLKCDREGNQKWRDLYMQTKELRQHNYDVFFDQQKLSVEINKTLNLFLEFADGC